MSRMPLNQIVFGKTDAFNELNTFGQEFFVGSFVANPKYHIEDFLSGSRFFICGKRVQESLHFLNIWNATSKATWLIWCFRSDSSQKLNKLIRRTSNR